MPYLNSVAAIDAQLKNLRSSISDLGHQIDSYKAKSAAAAGAGVFLLLLAALATYDLSTGKSEVWGVQGLSREILVGIAIAFGGGAIILLVYAFTRITRRDHSLDARLDLMEQEYAELVEQRSRITGNQD
ncbi:MAG TPA: hypothetical protein VKF81_12490 [Blastocatellia bacterium]|nr:hypothetical protein [Blastocatellia bacterium]